MFELIALAVTLTVAFAGFYQSRVFVRKRLEYVDAVQKPLAPLVAGAAAIVLAAPVVWLLPFVGGGTASLFGLGVGSGVAAGRRDIRNRLGAG